MSEVLRVCPFGILTLLNDGCPVGKAPPCGLMKLLVAPEPKTALCPNILLNDFVGSLKSFLILNSSFNLSTIGAGMCGSHWSIGSLTKFAWGSNSSQVDRVGFQSGGKGRSLLGPMSESCPPQNRPPSEAGQQCGLFASLHCCLLLFIGLCCLGKAWFQMGFS